MEIRRGQLTKWKSLTEEVDMICRVGCFPTLLFAVELAWHAILANNFKTAQLSFVAIALALVPESI